MVILNTDNKEASPKIKKAIRYHWPSIGGQPNMLTADLWQLTTVDYAIVVEMVAVVEGLAAGGLTSSSLYCFTSPHSIVQGLTSSSLYCPNKTIKRGEK